MLVWFRGFVFCPSCVFPYEFVFGTFGSLAGITLCSFALPRLGLVINLFCIMLSRRSAAGNMSVGGLKPHVLGELEFGGCFSFGVSMALFVLLTTVLAMSGGENGTAAVNECDAGFQLLPWYPCFSSASKNEETTSCCRLGDFTAVEKTGVQHATLGPFPLAQRISYHVQSTSATGRAVDPL